MLSTDSMFNMNIISKCMVCLTLPMIYSNVSSEADIDINISEILLDGLTSEVYVSESVIFEEAYNEFRITVHEKIEKYEDSQFPDFTYTITIFDVNNKLLKSTYEYGGQANNIWLNDLDKDSNFELYIFIKDVSHNPFNHLVVYEWHNNRLIQRYLPDIPEENMSGIRGYDKFYLDNDRIIREFNIYNNTDSICCPTGGVRKLYYIFLDDKYYFDKVIDR